MPGGRAGQHQPGGLRPVQPGRPGHQGLRRDEELGGVRTGRSEGDHLVAHGERASRSGRVRPDGGDHPGGLGAEPERQPGRILAECAAVRLVIDRVDAAGADFDAGLAGAGLTDGLVRDGQHFRTAVCGG